MKIGFLGAARTVTGSCHLLETDSGRILVDCGLHQGRDKRDWDDTQPFVFDPKTIDCVLLTHAHIDHAGLLPLLVKNGFNGPIFCTPPTADLCGIMLPDSGHIHEMEAIQLNKRRQRLGKDEVKPLYTVEEAEACIEYFVDVEYRVITQILPNVNVRFREAGHILGSSFIEIWVEENEKETKIVFSGDVGTYNRPILKDPAEIHEADYIVMESTYGDRLHGEISDAKAEFRKLLKEVIAKKGNLIIPSFAVGRTQELLYDLNLCLVNNDVPGLENIPIYVDSPLATRATDIFRKDYYKFYDDEAKSLVEHGTPPLGMKNLIFTESVEESRAINEDDSTKIIISTSGMCEAGRIRHHLKHNLWKENATVVFVGYQAENTLGRIILEGARTVKIFGEEILIKATIKNISGYSGHADKNGLLKWLKNYDGTPKKVFLVHGESNVCDAFAKSIHEELGLDVMVPDLGTWVDLYNEKVTHSKDIKELTDNDKNNIIRSITDVINSNSHNKQEILSDIMRIIKKWDNEQ